MPSGTPNLNKLPSVFRETCGTNAGAVAHSKKRESLCNPCRIASRTYAKAHRDLTKNRDGEKTATRATEYRNRNKQKIKEYQAKNYKNKREEILTRNAEWREANLKKIVARQLEYAKENPDIKESSARKTRAKRYGVASESFTVAQVLELYGTDCHICLKPIDFNAPRSLRKTGWEKGLQLDHVIPFSRGGENLLSNVRPSHAACNNYKHRRLMEELDLEALRST